MVLNNIWNDAAAKYGDSARADFGGRGGTATINKLVANYHVIARDTVTRTNMSRVHAVDDFIELIFSFFFFFLHIWTTLNKK